MGSAIDSWPVAAAVLGVVTAGRPFKSPRIDRRRRITAVEEWYKVGIA